MDNDTTNQKTCKNISEFPFAIVEGGDTAQSRDPISSLPSKTASQGAALRRAGSLSRGHARRGARAPGDAPGHVDPAVTELASPGPVSCARKEPRARLQTLLDNAEEIKRNRKRRAPAEITPKGRFAGPTHKPAFLDEVNAISEPTAQDFRDLRRLTLNLSREQCGKLFRLHRATIMGWEYGLRRIPFSAYLVLRLLGEGHGSPSRAVVRTRGTVEYLPKSESALPSHPVHLDQPGRYESRRERANMLRERMHRFSSIYNAAWDVRDAAFGNDERRNRSIRAFADVLTRELWNCDDPEGLVYAVADALTLSPLGLPWEA